MPTHGPDVFSRPDATVPLGVGKNMVHAIRYSGLAYKILAEAPNPAHPRRTGVAVTPFGEVLLNEDGWDPYLEQSGTLWLLHWQLLAPPCAVPVWWATFHALEATSMDDADLPDRVLDVIAAVPGWPRVAGGSVKKDVDCLLRMYASRSGGRQSVEDLLDCPFRELGLMEPVAGEPRAYRFAVGSKPTLPDAVVAYASPDFAAALGADSVWVLSTGYSCALPNAPRGALAMALHSLTLVVNQRLAVDIERFEPMVDLRVVPPLCPIRVPPSDFSQSSQLIDRAHASTTRWLPSRHAQIGQAELVEHYRHDDRRLLGSR